VTRNDREHTRLRPWSVGLVIGLAFAVIAGVLPSLADAHSVQRCSSATSKHAPSGCPRVAFPRSASQTQLIAAAGALNPKLRRDVARHVPSTVRLLDVLANAATKARPASALPTQELALPSPDGGKSTGTVTLYADDAKTFDVGADGQSTTQVDKPPFKGTLRMGLRTRVRVDKCPASDGTVAGHWEFIVSPKLDLTGRGGSAKVISDGRLIGEATAYVGDDARIKYYDLTVRAFVSVSAHGNLVDEGEFGTLATANQSISFTHLDPHTLNVSVSQIKTSGEVSGDWTEKGLNALSDLVGKGAVLAVSQLNDAFLQKSEHNFYDDAACLKLKVTPPGSPVPRDRTINLDASVTPAAGGPEAAQKITATADGLTITPGQDHSSAGSPARFTITTSSDAHESVQFEGVSKRGRSLDAEHWMVLGQVNFTANRAAEGDEYDADPALSQPLLLTGFYTNLTFTATIPLTSVTPVGTDGSFVATGSAPFELASGPEVDDTTDYLNYPGAGCKESLTSWTPGRLQVTVTDTENPATGQLSYVVSYTVTQDIMGTYTDCNGYVEQPTSVLVGIYPWVVGQAAVYSDKFTPFGTQGGVQRAETTTSSDSTPSDQGSETDTTLTQILG
jgi:hypothetical protein